jgi:hypothetical protein
MSSIAIDAKVSAQKPSFRQSFGRCLGQPLRGVGQRPSDASATRSNTESRTCSTNSTRPHNARSGARQCSRYGVVVLRRRGLSTTPLV